MGEEERRRRGGDEGSLTFSGVHGGRETVPGERPGWTGMSREDGLDTPVLGNTHTHTNINTGNDTKTHKL